MATTAPDLASVDQDGDNDGEHLPKRVGRRRKPRNLPLPLYKANVKSLADVQASHIECSTSDVDGKVIARIKSCLDRANHPSTPEAEAKVALHMASRLMAQHNVSQSEVLAHVPPSEQKQYAGQSVVSIQRRDGNRLKAVRHQTFLEFLCNAMEDFFDCKSYSVQKWSDLEFTFYGIAENTIAAAMALEMVYNLIAEWARPYKGPGPKNSYCLGVSHGLQKSAEREKKAEEARAIETEQEAIAARMREEQLETQARLDRLARSASDSPLPSIHTATESIPDQLDMHDGDFNSDAAYVEAAEDLCGDDDASRRDDVDDDEESSDDCIEADFKLEKSDDDLSGSVEDLEMEFVKAKQEYETNTKIKQEYETNTEVKQEYETNTNVKQEYETNTKPPIKSELEPRWASRMQLVAFRQTASRIADDYLKDHDKKLYSGRTRHSVVRDWGLYMQGEKDSQKIDVRQKRIEQ